MVLSPTRRGMRRKLRHDVDRVRLERTNEVDELDDVEPPLAGLNLGNERLWFRHAVRQIGLRQADGLAQRDEATLKHAVTWRPQGRWHLGDTGKTATGLSDNPDSGLSHFGIFRSNAASRRAVENKCGHG